MISKNNMIYLTTNLNAPEVMLNNDCYRKLLNSSKTCNTPKYLMCQASLRAAGLKISYATM